MSEISEAIKQKAAEMESENDLITIPRGLLGAALAVIKRPERDSANVIELLRYYAFAKEAPVALRERAEPVAYADPQAFRNFQAGTATKEWVWAKPAAGLVPVFVEAPPAPFVPEDVLAALRKVAKIRLDFNDFDGDRRGMANCLGEAEEALIEVVNRRADMLAAPAKN
ncbi:hypothetical protein SMX82_002404 [Cronobacter sakazakii]|nr:hypothetical protein [Cronobacter sakazakii]